MRHGAGSYLDTLTDTLTAGRGRGGWTPPDEIIR
jgi:hypothetical protein